MERKLGEYFDAGTQIVWLVDPAAKSVTVHTSPDAFRTLTGADAMTAGAVLPGFQIAVQEVFSRAGLA
jgi:Uma2 family endonuclease